MVSKLSIKKLQSLKRKKDIAKLKQEEEINKKQFLNKQFEFFVLYSEYKIKITKIYKYYWL